MEEEAIEASDVRRTSRTSIRENLKPRARGQVGTHTHGDAARLESIRWLSGEWGKQFLLGGDPSADHTIIGIIGDCSGRPV